MSNNEVTIYLGGILVALVGAVIHYHIKSFKYWSSRGVPGPRPWPFFGTNVYYLFGNKLEVDQKFREQYGHTYGLYEGYSPLLRTTDIRLLKQIYIKQFSSFTDHHGRFIYGDVQRNWLIWSKGSTWSNQRALVSPMFSSTKMRLMFNQISQCIENFATEVDRRMQQKSAKNDMQTTMCKQDLSSLTLDVIATNFFSLKLNSYDVTKNEFLRQAYSFAKISIWWFILWIMTPHFIANYLTLNLFRNSKLAYFVKLAEQILDERRRMNTGGKTDIIQAFLDAKLPETYKKVYTQEDDKEAHYNDQLDHKKLENIQQEQTEQAKLFKHFTDVEIRGQMTFLILAGFETTASTLSFCFYELAHQQEAQKLIYEELKAKYNSDEKMEQTIENYSDLLNLKLLDSFVSEVLRLYSPLIENNRIVTEPEGVDMALIGEKTIHLPQGMPISTNSYILQRDEDYFDKSNEFDLMRFHPDNRDKLKSCTFMPFGLGPRSCVGMRFALMEMKLAVAKIVSRYIVTPGPNNTAYPPKYTPNAIFLQFQNTDFTLRKRHP